MLRSSPEKMLQSSEYAEIGKDHRLFKKLINIRQMIRECMQEICDVSHIMSLSRRTREFGRPCRKDRAKEVYYSTHDNIKAATQAQRAKQPKGRI